MTKRKVAIPREDVSERCIHGHEGFMIRSPQISANNGVTYDVWRCTECSRLRMKTLRAKRRAAKLIVDAS